MTGSACGHSRAPAHWFAGFGSLGCKRTPLAGGVVKPLNASQLTFLYTQHPQLHGVWLFKIEKTKRERYVDTFSSHLSIYVFFDLAFSLGDIIRRTNERLA